MMQTHCHNFAEMMRGQRGEALHIVNGRQHPFGEGDLIMLRPDDSHSMHVPEDGHLVFDIMAFSGESFQAIRKRHFDSETLFWNGDQPHPEKIQLSIIQTQWLTIALEELTRDTDSFFLLERFLLNFAFEILDQARPRYQSCPSWLRSALHKLDDMHYAQQGTAVLSELTGYCPEHVSRILKRCTGLTPTQIVNQARLEHAAAQLILSDKTIFDIALTCGFSGLGHFYKLFVDRYQMPPKKYRQTHRRLVPMGEF